MGFLDGLLKDLLRKPKRLKKLGRFLGLGKGTAQREEEQKQLDLFINALPERQKSFFDREYQHTEDMGLRNQRKEAALVASAATMERWAAQQKQAKRLGKKQGTSTAKKKLLINSEAIGAANTSAVTGRYTPRNRESLKITGGLGE